jgi:hypothetical protein
LLKVISFATRRLHRTGGDRVVFALRFAGGRRAIALWFGVSACSSSIVIPADDPVFARAQAQLARTRRPSPTPAPATRSRWFSLQPKFSYDTGSPFPRAASPTQLAQMGAVVVEFARAAINWRPLDLMDLAPELRRRRAIWETLPRAIPVLALSVRSRSSASGGLTEKSARWRSPRESAMKAFALLARDHPPVRSPAFTRRAGDRRDEVEGTATGLSIIQDWPCTSASI